MSVGAPERRLLALGDSYTIGEGVAPHERWPEQLATALRERGIGVADPQIVATTGWTTDELLRGIEAVHPRGSFALVSLLIGVNNQYRGRDTDDYRAQFRSLLGRAIGFAGGTAEQVIVISIPDWGVTPFAEQEARDPLRIAEEIGRFNGVNREEALDAGASYVDITPASRVAEHDRSLLAADGLHPSGRMYAEWVRLILPVARRVLGDAR
jgi:lysophospholipase L1-like esterase